MAITIDTQIDGSKATIAVGGRLAVDSAPELDATVQQLPNDVCDIKLDLTDTVYVSSAGLRVFVKANKLALRRGGTFCVAHPTDEVMDVLTMTGISELIDIER